MMNVIRRIEGTFLNAESLAMEWADFSQRVPGMMNQCNTMVPTPIPTSSPATNAHANKPAMMPMPSNNPTLGPTASIPDGADAAAVSSSTNTPTTSILTASTQQH
jgi:hypothetical protein